MRFVVTSSTLRSDQANALTELWLDRKLNVWHWFHASWLINDQTGETTLDSLIHDILSVPDVDRRGILVIAVKGPVSWTGFPPDESVPWLQDYFGDPPEG